MLQYYLYRVGQFLVNYLPLKFSYGFAIFLSDLHYFLSKKDRSAVKNNLQVMLGLQSKEEVSKLAREVFRNFGRYLMEFFRMAKDVNDQFISEKVKVINAEGINTALKGGKGVILFTAHIGNWELGGVCLSLLGYPITAIALPHKERSVNELFNQQREIKGIRVVPTRLAFRKCIETLKENKAVAILADRDFSEKGEVMEFLGKKTMIPKGAAILSSRTGAPLVSVFVIREAEGAFSIQCGDPIYPAKEVEGEVDKETLLPIMQNYKSVIESAIRKYPTQWLMFREFWVS